MGAIWLNARERFQRLMHFKEIDRIPLWDLEGITPGTISEWVKQGFPNGPSPWDYFNFDKKERLPINFDPIPSYVNKIREENDEYRTFINNFGFTEVFAKKYGSGYRAYHYIDTPVKTRKDWKEYKKRYQPDPRRFPLTWGEELFEYYRDIEWPVEMWMVWGPGRGPKAGYTLGVEKFLATLVRDPDWVHDIMGSYADFALKVLKEVVKVKLDIMVFMEDGLAYKHGTIISPRIYEEFFYPYHKKVTDFLRSNGVDIICEYTSGNIEALVPLFLKAGFNLFGPLEVAAGMDHRKLREEYGDKILLWGNMGRQSLMDGPDAVEKEFNAKVQGWVEQGGYLPVVDDMILPDISFASYSRYVKLLKEYKMKYR